MTIALSSQIMVQYYVTISQYYIIVSPYHAMKSHDRSIKSKPKDTKRPLKPLPGLHEPPHRQTFGSEFEIGAQNQQEIYNPRKKTDPRER